MAKKKISIWNLLDALEGDKVVWCIVVMLLLISIVCIFSSTSRLLGAGQTRLDIVGSQLVIVGAGVLLILICYWIKDIEFFRLASIAGFPLSLLLLVLLLTGGIGPLKAETINGATRTLSVFGAQVHVFEIVKVAMVMYLSWAVDAVKTRRIPFLKQQTSLVQKIVFIYVPFIVTTLLILPGSNSSAVLIGGIMFLTIFIGGGNVRDALLLLMAGAVILAIAFGTYKIASTRDGYEPGRIGTLVQRFVDKSTDYELIARTSKPGSEEYRKAMDKLSQPYSAKIAIHQGGLIGKGPGQSTQRYAVPDMSEDFMFSFIIEEYGLLGGIFIIILYVSLLSRGALISNNCKQKVFPKCAIAGLTLLISGQAFMHMFVNAGIGPLTGQTLPLISHGNSAFICFSIAFGIILSISRIAERDIKRLEREADSLLDVSDNINSLDDLEKLEDDEL